MVVAGRGSHDRGNSFGSSPIRLWGALIRFRLQIRTSQAIYITPRPRRGERQRSRSAPAPTLNDAAPSLSIGGDWETIDVASRATTCRYVDTYVGQDARIAMIRRRDRICDPTGLLTDLMRNVLQTGLEVE